MKKIIAKNLIFIPLTLLRGENILKYLRYYEKTQWEPKTIIENLQKTNLDKLLEHAYQHSKFYKKMLNSKKVDYKNFRTIFKRDLQNSAHIMFSNNYRFKGMMKSTGGSTGEPVKVYKNISAMAREHACMYRGYRWAGIDICDPQVRFWGVPLSRESKIKASITDLATNRIRLSAFRMDKDSFNFYFKKINFFKPKYFYGYVSFIKIFCVFLKENNLQLHFQLKAVITTAELLLEEDKAFIEAVLNCKVYNEYGAGEIGTIAHECEYGNMHLNYENYFFDVVDEAGKQLPIGKLGNLVVTDLFNYSMPIIKYSIGDLVKLSEENCRCGRNLPVLKEIIGRAYDIVINQRGEKFHPSYFNYIFKEINKKELKVKQYQIIQKDINKLYIKVVSEFDLQKLHDELKNILWEDFSSELIIDVEAVNKIKREQSGKYRMVKSEIIDRGRET